MYQHCDVLQHLYRILLSVVIVIDAAAMLLATELQQILKSSYFKLY